MVAAAFSGHPVALISLLRRRASFILQCVVAVMLWGIIRFLRVVLSLSAVLPSSGWLFVLVYLRKYRSDCYGV